jgi:hypothetical protein
MRASSFKVTGVGEVKQNTTWLVQSLVISFFKNSFTSEEKN